MDPLPLVSCVIPSYNRPGYVRTAIESALTQTYSPMEVIVVDDGSTDETPDVAESFGERVKVIRQANGGSAAARNTGIAAASGEFVAWLDSDDAWLPEKIAIQVAAARDYPEAGIVYTHCQAIDGNDQPPPPKEPIKAPPARLREDILAMMVVESEVMPSSCLVRRTALDSVGWFNKDFINAEDWEFHFRMARQFGFVEVPAPLTRYRVHAASKTADRWPHAIGALQLRKVIEEARVALTAAQIPGIEQAYAVHERKYAEVCYKVGKLAADRGDFDLGLKMLREARRRNPRVVKYHTRLLQASVRSLSAAGASTREN